MAGKQHPRALQPSQANGFWVDSIQSRPLVAGVETGGTKTVFGLAAVEDPTTILLQHRIETTSPEETLAAVDAAFASWTASLPVTALGVASFGPLDVESSSPTYGTIFDTPKRKWEGISLLAGLSAVAAKPTVVYSDVTAAALGEATNPEARNGNLLYLTVGTGIGLGITLDGKPLQGRGYPEGGHLFVRRHKSDRFAGICPLHEDCAEGLAAGPAVQSRMADGEKPDEILEVVAYTLAQVILSGLYFTAAETVVVGGGVSSIRNLREVTAEHLALLRSPTAPPTIRAPRHEHSGLVGAMRGAALLANAAP